MGLTGLTSGDRIGDYRIERTLWRDDLCIAYAATHVVLPRDAVIEVMHSGGTRLGALRMLREACILEALRHPGVPRVYESGLVGDRRPWVARERVSGPTLAAVLSPWVLERAEAIALLRDLASVLEHAHRRGVIHCDLNPSRVLLADRSRGFPLCLADWSCARMHDAARLTHSVTPASWLYTAPELAAGEPIDERVDVFALGVIAYQMLTGAEPYEDRSVPTAPDGARFHVPTAFRCPGAPEELATLIDRMLAYACEERPSSAEVHDGLAQLAAQLAETAPASAPAPRIRRPRWTPPIAFEEVPGAGERTDACVPVPISDDGLVS